jgi:hypothetical protein
MDGRQGSPDLSEACFRDGTFTVPILNELLILPPPFRLFVCLLPSSGVLLSAPRSRLGASLCKVRRPKTSWCEFAVVQVRPFEDVDAARLDLDFRAISVEDSIHV